MLEQTACQLEEPRTSHSASTRRTTESCSWWDRHAGEIPGFNKGSRELQSPRSGTILRRRWYSCLECQQHAKGCDTSGPRPAEVSIAPRKEAGFGLSRVQRQRSTIPGGEQASARAYQFLNCLCL